MICRDRRLKRGKDIDLPGAADLEYRSAPVSDVEILVFVESKPGCHSHSFDKHRHVPGRSDLINDAVVSARDVQQAFAIKCQTGRIHQISDKWLRIVVCVYLVYRNWRFLSSRSAEGTVDISFLIDGRIGYRVKAIRDLDSQMCLIGFTLTRTVRNDKLPNYGRIGNAGDHVRVSGHHKMGRLISQPDVRHACGGKIASADMQLTARDRGGRLYAQNAGPHIGSFCFLLLARHISVDIQRSAHIQDKRPIQSGRDIVSNYTEPARKSFQGSHG